MTSRLTWAVWGVLRLGGVVLLTGRLPYQQVDRDVFGYAGWAHLLYAGHLPWASFPVEYPPGVLPFMALPGGNTVYELQFMILALLADAVVLRLLWRERPNGLGSWLWVGLPVLLGPVMWVRFDVFVALALVGFIVALRRGRWRLAGGCLGAAALLKLWPLVVLVVLWRAIPAAGRRTVAAWCLSVIAVLTLPVVGFGGGSGLAWMLNFQGSRGLEIESVFAVPVAVAEALRGKLEFVAGHGALEFPVHGVTALATGVVLPLTLALACGWAWTRGRGSSVGVLTLLVVAVSLSTAKMLSPQYVVWAVAVVAVVVDEQPLRVRRDRARLVVATGALALASQLVFPFYFWSLVYGGYQGVTAATLHGELVLVWLAVVVGYVRGATTASPAVDPAPGPQTSRLVAAAA